MPELKHTVKDSVFSCIFRQPENIRELYCALHPEELRLSALYGGGEGDVEVRLRVLRDTGRKTIIDQYIRFCELCGQQRRANGNTEKYTPRRSLLGFGAGFVR